MNAFPFRDHAVTLALAITVLFSASAKAAGTGNDVSHADASGFSFFNDAANVTHWGLGGGVGLEQSPYRGYGLKVSPIPVLFFDDKWARVFGTTVDLKVGSWHHVAVALRGTYGIADGYRGSDAPILNGMQTRSSAFWFGPVMSWQTPLGIASATVLTAGDKGRQASLGFSKAFGMGRFGIAPHVGVDWFSSRYTDYYYGVMPSEAEAGRAQYTGKAAYRISVGTRVDYRLTARQSVSLDLGLSHLSSGITDSPLVDKKTVPDIRVVYVYQFK